MDNIAGSPVEGKNFFGRNDIAQRLREILDHDDILALPATDQNATCAGIAQGIADQVEQDALDILLLGPWRIGKTSLARAVMALAHQQGWTTIEINVASCIDEKGFLDKLEGELKKAIDSFAGKLLDGMRERLGALGKRIKSLKFGGFGATAEVGLAGSDADDWRRRATPNPARVRQRTAHPPRHARQPLADLRG